MLVFEGAVDVLNDINLTNVLLPIGGGGGLGRMGSGPGYEASVFGGSKSARLLLSSALSDFLGKL